MAHIDIAINELRDLATASRVEDEIFEAAERAAEPEDGHVGFSVLDEGRSVDIQVEVLGWVARRSVPPHPRPGQVRKVVQELLESVGLM
jgi:hypothetical protein